MHWCDRLVVSFKKSWVLRLSAASGVGYSVKWLGRGRGLDDVIWSSRSQWDL